ncbi:hypothetical protein ASG35_05485 [Burkholderia sp. Leaf177]|uniref:DMT family transporter n=1 Tax=Burkholderia sp. Leaf177 TaxID=1736287 RepID=UPI000700B583|nr:DMT family transporter [Burkholderia sp. Leaf177]KQR81742.1 hypothetical protein ASG35_05485 [Burkholderia sp. Leaf177]
MSLASTMKEELSAPDGDGRQLEKIIVAIHGVGNQRRSDTIRTVAHRFGALNAPPLPVMPLGFFSVGSSGEVYVSQLDVKKGHPLWNVGFAEVYWADVPREVVTKGDTLEESKAWGQTIVGRAQALYRGQVSQTACQVSDADFNMTASVTEEIVEAIAVMQNLCWVADKAGLFKFDLAPLLTDYIGDVQLVAEFRSYRKEIVDRFHKILSQIVEHFRTRYPDYPNDPQIHVIAHSEGTVISFLAMLDALSSTPDSANTYGWIRYVRGFMTIGSPIDKHLLLWPKLWPDDNLETADFEGWAPDKPVVLEDENNATRLRLLKPIKWRNYYDFGDPIGFQLDTARRYLREMKCGAFQFGFKDDFGFSRYPFPGKAHTDYWSDSNLFRHFFDSVVLPDPATPTEETAVEPPRNRPFMSGISLSIPYLLCAVLHLAAVYIMFKATTAFLAQGKWSTLDIFRTVISLSALLFSVTVASRLPRLVRRSSLRWLLLAAIIFACGVTFCLFALPPEVSDFLAGPFLDLDWVTSTFGAYSGRAFLLSVAIAIPVICWLLPQRPRWGRRVMVGSGIAVIAMAIVSAYPARSTTAPALWPLVLAALMFLYLWWLAILAFDLSFIWHRYIRNSVALDTLRDWRQQRDTTPRTFRARRPKDWPP